MKNLRIKNLLTGSLICLVVTIHGQSVIKGKILDSMNVPMPFATIALLKANDSSIVKGKVSNDRGEYFFENSPNGSYIIKAILVGYKENYSSIFSLDSNMTNYEVPDIFLISKEIELGLVSITAIKESIEFKDGMVIMNVEHSPLASGNTVFDLLKRLPGIIIDNQNNISLNGKSGVRIMLDGRIQQLSGQQLFSILSSMSAESISKIEVMNNPPVKYDAAGTAGIINIVSKKVKLLGFSGNASGSISKGIAYRGSTDGVVNYKGKNITLFSNFGYADRIFYNSYIFNKTINFNGNTTHLDENGKQIHNQQLFYYKVGTDYVIKENTTIGFLVNGGPASTPFRDFGVNQIKGYNDLGFDHSPFDVHITDNWSNPSYNINAEHRFDTAGTVLNFSADYANYTAKRSALSENYFLDINNIEALPANIFVSVHKTDIKILTQKLDFQKNITKSILFEIGVKGTFVNSQNEYTFEKQNYQTKIYEIDTSVSNSYIYRENIIAGYINFKKQFKKALLQIGGRAENTNADANNKTSGFKLYRNYFNFFPTITFDYPKSDKHNFQFSFTRRIDRPNYNDLNPYKSYQDNYSSTIGNPYLLPQTSYNFKFTYVFKQILYNTFTYLNYNNTMLHFDYQNDTTKETITAIRNIPGNNYYAYNLFIRMKIASWWNLTFSGNTYYQKFTGTLNGTEFNRSALAFNGNINNDIILPQNFKIQVNCFYGGPSTYALKNFKSRWSLDVGLKKTFFKEKLIINFSVFDIFYRNIGNISSKFQNQDYLFISRDDTRRIMLSIVYKFGKIKVQKRQVNSNDQEKGRMENKLK